MNMVQVLNVKLKRDDSNVPWGFDVKGGKDLNFPLAIQSVTPNSLADLASIRANSFIIKVGNVSTQHLTNDQAKELIFNQGNILEMTIECVGLQQTHLDFDQLHYLQPDYQLQRPSSFYSYLPRPSYQQEKQHNYSDTSSHSAYQPYSQQGSVQTVTVTHGNYGTSKTVTPPPRTSAVTTYPLSFVIPNPHVFTPSIRPYSFGTLYSGNIAPTFSPSNSRLSSQLEQQSDLGPTYKLKYGERYPNYANVGKATRSLTSNFNMENAKKFSTDAKCAGCNFPVKAGDLFYEALFQIWHIECFSCQHCHVPLRNNEYATIQNKPYCHRHAYWLEQEGTML